MGGLGSVLINEFHCWANSDSFSSAEEDEMARFDLSDKEWALIAPLLPNKPRGVARVDDRRVINAIFYVLRTGSPWRDLPERYGPYTTAYNRYNRWARAGVWLGVFNLLAAKSPQSLHLIDSSVIRAHQHAAGGKKGARITPSVVLVED
jgi:transposase